MPCISGGKFVLTTVINHDADNTRSIAESTHKIKQEACFHLHIFYSQSFYTGINYRKYAVYFGNRERYP